MTRDSKSAHFGGDKFKKIVLTDIPNALTRTPKDSMVVVWKRGSR